MSSLNNIAIKVKHILSYVEANNLSDKILDPKNSKTTYTIEQLLKGYFYYESCFTSYMAYDFFRNTYNLDIPSKSRINAFSIKISNMKLIEKVYTNFIVNEQIFDNDKYSIIDSTFIPNKCMPINNSIIGMNTYYKSKNGCKLTFITDSTGNKCLHMSIDSGNSNDSKIAVKFLQSLDETSSACIKNKTFLADSGYDTQNFKNELIKLNCNYIIPKNIRNENIIEYKKNKEKIISYAKEQKTKYWNEIKNMDKNDHRRKELRENIKNVTMNTKEMLCKILLEKRLNNKKNKANNKKERINKFQNSLTKENRKIYKKRLNIEHTNKKIKTVRLMCICVKSKEMLMNSVYNRFLDIALIEQHKTKRNV